MRFSRWVVCGALCLGAPGVAHAADAATPEKSQKAGAQQTFDAGSKLYDAHRYDEALAAFRASYQILASPNSHLMVARALRELGKNVEAYAEYDAVAREAGRLGERYESAGHAAAEEREEVKSKVSLLTVKMAGDPAGVTVKVGDTGLAPEALGIAVPHEPGAVAVTAERADGATAKSDVTLEAGGASEVTLTLVAKAAETPAPARVAAEPVHVTSSGIPLRTWAYASAGVGVVGLAVFGIFGGMSNSAYSSLESSCPNHTCPPGKSGDVDAGRRDQTIANVGLVLGVVGVGAGVTLFVVTEGAKKETATLRDPRMNVGSPRVRASIGPGTFTVDGRF